jgi:hypothetical protein
MNLRLAFIIPVPTNPPPASSICVGWLSRRQSHVLNVKQRVHIVVYEPEPCIHASSLLKSSARELDLHGLAVEAHAVVALLRINGVCLAVEDYLGGTLRKRNTRSIGETYVMQLCLHQINTRSIGETYVVKLCLQRSDTRSIGETYIVRSCLQQIQDLLVRRRVL